MNVRQTLGSHINKVSCCYLCNCYNTGHMVCCVVVQSLNHVQIFATPWTPAHQASLSITNSQSLLKLMSLDSVMPSSHLILCRPLLPPSIFPSIRVSSNESALGITWLKCWSLVFGSLPMSQLLASGARSIGA